MTRVMVAALVSLTVACGSGAALPARAQSPAEIDADASRLCSPLHDVLLPHGSATGPSLTDVGGKLAIDGTVTALAWRERTPYAYALADGRAVLAPEDAPYELSLWDPRTRTLTPLGTGGTTMASTLGFLVHTESDASTVVFFGVDPHAPRLRELYRRPQSLPVIGTLDGALAILEGQSELTMNAAVVCLSGPGDTTRIPIHLPPSMQIAGEDAIRDHRLLLVGDVRDPPHLTGGREPFGVPVAILDLDTGALRPLGEARGSYTVTTNLPHREARVGWCDVRGSSYGEPPPCVDVATEAVR